MAQRMAGQRAQQTMSRLRLSMYLSMTSRAVVCVEYRFDDEEPESIVDPDDEDGEGLLKHSSLSIAKFVGRITFVVYAPS